MNEQRTGFVVRTVKPSETLETEVEIIDPDGLHLDEVKKASISGGASFSYVPSKEGIHHVQVRDWTFRFFDVENGV